tara:strand:- start:89073 stop:89450 length:378 start_codon:yes stop_codon:yes gene_type:complete
MIAYRWYLASFQDLLLQFDLKSARRRDNAPEGHALDTYPTTSHLQTDVHVAANARLLGSTQLDAYKAHDHTPPDEGSQTFVGFRAAGSEAIAGGGGDYTTFLSTAKSGGSETRSVNTAFLPFINL